MAEAKGPYVPNNDELTDEVADILIELDQMTPSAREVLEALSERQGSWSVPEHRVAKYVDEYNLRRGEFGPPTDDDDSVRSGASRGSAASDGDRRRSRFIVKGASYSIGKILSGKTKAAKQQLGITRLDRRKMHFKAPQKTRPRRGSRSNNNNDPMSDLSASDNPGDDLLNPTIGQTTTTTTTTTTSTPSTIPIPTPMGNDSKVQKVPPKRPQRTLSEADDDELIKQSKAAAEPEQEDDKERKTPSQTNSFAEIDTDAIVNGPNDDDDEDADIVEEADKRSKFMMKGGSHSIQKVLKGEARAKKGVVVTRVDRRNMQFKKGVPKAGTKGKAQRMEDESDRSFSERASVASEVLESLGDTSYKSLGDSCSDNIDMGADTDDGEEFAAEVERRSKFIARGGTHSIQKVLAGEARSGGKSGPSRINRKNIPAKQNANTEDGAEDEVVEDPVKRTGPRTPVRTISCDSTDSQIEDEASRRSRFMLKGASHSIRNLLSGKAKKEKRGSALDRRKLHFKHEANAVHYTETAHPKPQEINDARLKAEAELKERAASRKAAGRVGRPKKPQRNLSVQGDEPQQENKELEPSSSHAPDEDEALEAEADRRSIMFKGGSHSIRKLFSGKGKKATGGGVSRFNRRKMHFKKESEAVHYTEKPHLKPAEINARHQQEAARLRETATSTTPADDDDDVPMLPKRVSGNDISSRTDIGEEESPSSVLRAVEQLHGSNADDSGARTSQAHGESMEDPDEDLGLDTDDDIIEEADKRSKFIMKGGSHSIQKVLRGEAKAKKGVSRFNRQKMQFKKESEAVHGQDAGRQEMSESQADVLDDQTSNAEEEDLGLDTDDDIIEEADKRSKFIMKGGSHSIQKVLRGEAKAKKGVSRFNRQKMQFKKESPAIDCHDQDAERQEASESQAEVMGDQSANAEEEDLGLETDDDIIEEADKRSKFMMKGGSHSIQKVLRGEAKAKKEGVTRFDRRKMHFKHEAEAVHYSETPHLKPEEINARHQQEAADQSANAEEDDLSVDADDDIIEEADKRSKFMMKGGSHSIQKVLRGEAKAKKEGVTRFDRRKMHFKHEAEAVHYAETPHLKPEEINARHQQEAADQSANAEDDDLGLDTDDDIIEEADKRTKKEGVTHFDRRKMHFKHESDAIHGHDGEMASQAPKDRVVKRPTRMVSVEANSSDAAGRTAVAKEKADDSEEFDEDELELLAQAESDPRQQMMLKGAGHSIRNIFSGKAKKEKKAAAGMARRTSQLKRPSEVKSPSLRAGLGDESEQGLAVDVDVEDDPSISNRDEEGNEKGTDRRSRFTLKGASNSIRNLLGRKSGKKEKPIDAEIARLQAQSQEFGSSEVTNNVGKDDNNDEGGGMDDEDREIEEEASRRSNFMAKGGSYSITKVLAGTAKKKEGITRLDRRKMHFKKESEAIHSHDADSEAFSQELSARMSASNAPIAQTRAKATSTSAPRKPIRAPLTPPPAPKGPRRPDDNSEQAKLAAEILAAEDSDDGLDLDEEDAAILEEADKRSNFMSKGGSYSIQKVLKGEARTKKEGVTRFDRRKMHFKHESDAIHCHDHDPDPSDHGQTTTAPDAAPELPAKPLVASANAKMPSRRVSDDVMNDDNNHDAADESVPDNDDDLDLLAQADERTQMMLKGGSHSIRNMFSGTAKKKDAGTGFKRRTSQMKQLPVAASHKSLVPHSPAASTAETAATAADVDHLESTQGSTEDLTANPKEDTKDDDDIIEDEDEAESGDGNRRSRFTLKGASHSIKKVLSGKARAKKDSGVTRLDRRRIQLKSKSVPSTGMDVPSKTPGGNK